MSQTMQGFPMRAAAIDGFGQAVTPHVVPVPVLDKDEVLIHVEAAGVGVWDPFEQEGGFAKMGGGEARFPYVLGSDGAGTVVEVGEQVKGLKAGERVYAYAFMNPKGGFYAEYAAVKESQASWIPGKLSVEEAAVMPIDAITAMRGLEDALGVKAGETVLVFGASGGVGHLAVELAKRMGARVFAVASGEDGVAYVEGLGVADEVVDGHGDDVSAAIMAFAPEGIDKALLTAGGRAAEEAVKGVKKGGRVAYPNGVEPEPKVPEGVEVKVYDGVPSAETVARINELIGKGPFAVHVARTFPLEQADAALKALGEHYVGKIALRIEG